MTEKTLSALIENRIKKYGSKLLLQRKDGWSWKQITWLDFERDVKNIACYLMDSGFSPGDAVIVISPNRLESLYTEFAVNVLGGVYIPLGMGDEIFEIPKIAKEFKVKFIFVENENVLISVKSVSGELEDLKGIVVFSKNRGIDERVIHFRNLVKFGLIKRKQLDDDLRKLCSSVQPDYVASVFYILNPSGNYVTKVFTHEVLIESLKNGSQKLSSLVEEDQSYSYLSSVNPFEIFVNYLVIYMGFRMAIAENRKDFFEDVLEIKPTVIFETQRGLEVIWSKLFAKLGGEIAEKRLKVELGNRLKYIVTDSMPGAGIKSLFQRTGVSIIEVSEFNNAL
ncbi:MAG: AMP-binding protein [Thermodesulfobacteriota bacterium]